MAIDYSDWEKDGLEEIRKFEAWQEAQIRKETWIPIKEYYVMMNRQKGVYRVKTLVIYKNSDGDLGYSNGNDKPDPIPGTTASSINRETIDTLLVRLITGTEELKPINPATKIGNYLSLVTAILSDVKVH